MKTRVAVVALSFVSAIGLYADTVAWWHFNEGANGQATVNGEATVLNAVDPTKHALKAGVLSTGNALVDGYDQNLPVYTNAFPDYATWRIPGGAKGADNRGMYFNPQNGDGTGRGSVLYTELTDELKLQSLTVELFIKADYAGYANHWKNLIVAGGDGNLDAWGFRVNQSGALHFRQKVSDKNSVGISLDGVNALDGKWHHVAFTFDGATKRLTLYFDYTQSVSTVLNDALQYVDEERKLEIGSFNKANYGRWRGWVDEVRISDTVLSSSEFLRPATFGEYSKPASSEPDTVFYSSFDRAFDDNFFSEAIGLNEAAGTNVYPAYVIKPAGGAYPEFSSENMPHGYVHSGIFASNNIENAGYWNFVTNEPGLSAMIDVDDVRETEDGALVHDLTSGSCTMEMFVKPRADHANSMYLACQHAAGGTGSMLWQILSSRQVRAELMPTGSTDRIRITSAAIAADEWHHVALVLDRDAETAELFVDYESKGKVTGFVMNPAVDTTKYSRYLQLFGGYGHDHNVQMHGAVDDVRITKRALKPYEFLKAGAVEPEPVGRTRAWFSFDGDYTVKPRTNDIPQGVPTVDGAFSASVPNVLITDVSGNVLSETNRSSSLLSNVVKYKRNVLADPADMRTQTLEFFIRFDAAPSGNYNSVFRFNDADSADAVYGVRIQSSGAFDMRVDTISEKNKDEAPSRFNQGNDFGATGVFDGNWHHVAFTFEPDDAGNTLMKFYLDYEYVASRTAWGTLRTVGGGELANTSFTIGSSALSGAIDEIRISQGVLDVSEMLRATFVKGPFVIVIR